MTVSTEKCSTQFMTKVMECWMENGQSFVDFPNDMNQSLALRNDGILLQLADLDGVVIVFRDGSVICSLDADTPEEMTFDQLSDLLRDHIGTLQETQDNVGIGWPSKAKIES